MGASIAIVGLACEYPDARDPGELFDNVLAGRRAFRRIPDERLPLAEYGSVDADDVDRTYVTQAALIEGYDFDRQRFKVVGSTYRSADLSHWLALDVADRALSDAGFPGAEGLARDRAAVILGNTLTGEFSRAQAMRLRWPYVRRSIEETLPEWLDDEAARRAFLDALEARYKTPFEPFGDESLAGGLANTIAGRICNFFDLGGGGYTVDGACSSSLLALSQAATTLQAGDADVALAGGVDISLDPFELVGFARAGALAREEMRVYDRRSNGFWPGEGCGIAVLMREQEARAQGRNIRAILRGWGVASDGAGGISRPEEQGQLRALERAYARAGISPADVALFEGHGTGTTVGDATELSALDTLLERNPRAGAATALGSIKANIGHTKAAAGIAGLLKAVGALERETLPPTPGCGNPHPLVDARAGARLRVPSGAEAWPEGRPGFAAVSSMGFGGINVHLVLEAAREPTRSPLAPRTHALSTSAQDSEIFVWSAATSDALKATLRAHAESAPARSHAELSDLAAHLSSQCGPGPLRAAAVASRPDALRDALHALADQVSDARADRAEPWIDAERGLFLGRADATPRIGLLFPGQGAPVPAQLGALEKLRGALPGEDSGSGEASGRYADLVASLGVSESSVPDTAIAQPAIVAASLAASEWLEALGVRAERAVGHSVGELAALGWAGGLSHTDAVAWARTRGRILSEHARPGGSMAALAAAPEEVQELAAEHACVIAAFNGPRRCVVAGTREEVDQVLAAASRAGVPSVALAVSHAFHSPHMEPAGPALEASLAGLQVAPCQRAIHSTVTGAELSPRTDWRAHLLKQLSWPVRFAEALRSADERVDVWLELGPGRMLTSLVREFSQTPVIPTEVGSTSARGLLLAVAAAWVTGCSVPLERLFSHRITKPIDPDREPRLFVNPCESSTRERSGPDPKAQVASEVTLPDTADGNAITALRALIAKRTELPASLIGADDRLLSDLHLTSIAVSELASRAARQLDRPPLVEPGEFADATVAELAQAIEATERTLVTREVAQGVEAWVRAFEVVERVRPAPRVATRSLHGAGGARWQVFAAPGDDLAKTLAESLSRASPLPGTLVHLPGTASARNLRLLLAAARAAYEGLDSRHFVLVHHGDPDCTLARTLHQEARGLSTRIVELPAEGSVSNLDTLAAWISAELAAGAGFLESRYDASGARFERRLVPLALGECEAPGALALPLSEADVVLVSGGGKGVAAELAFDLARRSGCALGLLGRSRPEDSPELAGNLQRLEALGLRFHYVSVDVAEAEALREALAQVSERLGPVTMLIHGAGLNQPTLLPLLNEALIEETCAPKCQGLETLLDSLDADRLRQVLALGSVIAQLGMKGEAHYALANERMARTLERYAAEHAQVRCLALESSIWSGVGMGERLGRVELLKARNITPISPDVGLAWARRLLCAEDLPVRVFLSGRFGDAPTLRPDESELPMRRFIEHVREHTPGIELVVDARLSFTSDPYLGDHRYAGTPLLPGVLGLEAMAQVGMALLGSDAAPVFEQVEFRQPVVVPEDGSESLRIAALARDGARVSVALRCAASDYAIDHMKAELNFAAAGGPLSPTIDLDAGAPVDVDPAREFYGDLFFQAGRFQRVERYLTLHSGRCAARIRDDDAPCFGPLEPQTLVLGDAGARDAAIHAVQACVPDRDLLPVGVERIETRGLAGRGERTLRARERSREPGGFVYDLEIQAPDGEIVERWSGLRLREVGGGARRQHWPPALLAPQLEERAAQHWPGLEVRIAIAHGDDRDATRRAAQIAGAPTSPHYRPDGRPELPGALQLSASHAQGHTLVLLSRQPAACDWETVRERPLDTWADLLGREGERLARHLARSRNEPFALSATRIWCAFECLRKLGLARETPLVVSSAPEEESVQLRAGELTVFTDAARLVGRETPAVIALASSAPGGTP